MATPTRRSADKRTTGAQRASGQWLLGMLIVLALVASVMMVWSDQLTVRASVAVIAALWAAVLGAIGITRYRRQADVAEAKGRDMRLVYELQLEREIAARRQYEADIEAQIRRDVAAEANEDLRELQAQIAALRASLEALMGHELPDDRVALPNERLRELSSAMPSYAPDDSLLAATDFASTAPPAADGRHFPPQGGRDDLTEIIPVVEDDPAPYVVGDDPAPYVVGDDPAPYVVGDDPAPYVSPFHEPPTYTVPVDADHYTVPSGGQPYVQPTGAQDYSAQDYSAQDYSAQDYGSQAFEPAQDSYVAPVVDQPYESPWTGGQAYSTGEYAAEETQSAAFEAQDTTEDADAAAASTGEAGAGGEYPTDAWVTPSAGEGDTESGGRRRSDGQHHSGISAAELLSQLRGSQSGEGTPRS